MIRLQWPVDTWDSEQGHKTEVVLGAQLAAVDSSRARSLRFLLLSRSLPLSPFSINQHQNSVRTLP